MSASLASQTDDSHHPLITSRFITRAMAALMTLAVVTAGISLAGRWYGKNLAMAGYTTSTDRNDIFVGEDHLRLASNVIRFADQRATGRAERVDLSLTWPSLQGYTTENRDAFSDINHPERLIFLQISQSTMSRDMSGRLAPIYSHIFKGAPEPAVAGLSRHRLQDMSGYGDEVFFTAERPGKPTYVVRCILPVAGVRPTSADCQRDVLAGRDLAVLYRFSSQLLPQWQAIDDAVTNFVASRLVP